MFAIFDDCVRFALPSQRWNSIDQSPTPFLDGTERGPQAPPSCPVAGDGGFRNGTAVATPVESVDPARLAEFSDGELERELARRRHGGAQAAGSRATGVVAPGGVCAPTGGVCVPCFEIA